MRRNNMLEKELKNLRESMGMPFTTASHNNTSPYSAPGHLASPRTSPYPSSNDMTTAAPAAATSAPMPDYPSGYVSFGNPAPVTDAWPVAAMSGPSNVSSPCSSIADEYGAGNGYLPTSAPNPMVAPPVNNSLAGHPEDIKLEYDDGTGRSFFLHPPGNCHRNA